MRSLTHDATRLLNLPGRLVHRVARYGIADACTWYWHRALWRARESAAGIDNSQFAYGLEVRGGGGCHAYEPVDPCLMEIVLNHLQADPQHDVFLDYGCGMGRAVLLAATRPYRRVLGVEIDGRLCEIARYHLSRARTRAWLRAGDVEILNVDAAAMAVPVEVTQIFLFNPFSGDLLQAVLERIHESLLERPRPLRIVHVQRVIDNEVLTRCSWLRWECELPTGFWSHVRTMVYAHEV